MYFAYVILTTWEKSHIESNTDQYWDSSSSMSHSCRSLKGKEKNYWTEVLEKWGKMNLSGNKYGKPPPDYNTHLCQPSVLFFTDGWELRIENNFPFFKILPQPLLNKAVEYKMSRTTEQINFPPLRFLNIWLLRNQSEFTFFLYY